MSTDPNKFDFERDFDMELYVQCRYRIERNKNKKLAELKDSIDTLFVAEAIKKTTGPTSLSIWASLQPQVEMLFAVHPHICDYMVAVATGKIGNHALLKSYMNDQDPNRDVQKKAKDDAYALYCESIIPVVGPGTV